MQGTSRRAIGMLSVAALVTLSAPTVYLSHAPAAAPEQPAVRQPTAADQRGPDEEKADGRPVRVDLPGGGVLELVAVCEHPSQGKQWWAPDGSLIEPPYQKFENECRTEDLTREMAVRWVKRPDEGVTVRWGPKGDISANGIGLPLDAEGLHIKDLEATDFAIRHNPKMCGLWIMVAAGPWENLCAMEADSNGLGSADAKHAFAFTRAFEAADKIVLTVGHDVLEDDVRIVAVGRDGKTIHNGACQGGGMKKFRMTTATFSDLKLADVLEFRVQSRPFERFEIRDISLWPGEPTNPKVVKITPERQQMDRTDAILRQQLELLDKVDGSTDVNNRTERTSVDR
jgi:hypothetical protein